MEKKDNKENEWKIIEILQSEYIISTSVKENFWKISLSNLVEIWMETITRDIASARCQSLNPLLDLESFDIKETLDAMLNDIPKYATDKSLDEIRLESCIDSIAFKFAIFLTKGSPQEFWNEITRPLCQSSIELQRRHRIIVNLIERKDAELSDYKLSGAKLTRTNIETSPYTDDIHRNEISIHSTKSKDCLTAFQSMFEVYNEFKKSASLLNNVCKQVPQRSNNPNSLGPDEDVIRENAGTSGMTVLVNVDNSNELQHKIEMENTTEDPPICKILPTVSEAEIIKRHRVGRNISRISESKITSKLEKELKEKATTNNVTNMSSTSIEQLRKSPKRLKIVPNIYDFIA